LFRLPGRGSVSDGDDIHPVFLQKEKHFAFRFLPLFRRGVGINDVHVKQFSRFIDDRQFASGPVGGIDAEDDFPLQRRLKQQLPQVFGKNMDRLFFRFLRQFVAHFPFDGRLDQTPVPVFQGLLQLFGADAVFIGDEPPF